METLQLLGAGFAGVLQLKVLVFAILGCVVGTLIGVLPGISAAGATAMLIPLTASLEPAPAIVMLAAIYYGAQYGGTITAVLVNTPGEAASAITCIEGYQMAKRGLAAPALSMAAIGSFIGGTMATLGLVLVAMPLAKLALKIGPPEFFALLLVGMALVTALAGKSPLLATVSAVLGLVVGMVGTDPVVGAPRFTLGFAELLDGFGVVPVMMGLFGVAEVLASAERGSRSVLVGSVRAMLPSAADLRKCWGAIARGTGIGFFLGLIPGLGAVVPTFASYAIERRVAKDPGEFGKGAIAGVAGPETANNAYANAALIPLFTLGIPGSPNVAVLLGAFMMNGLAPGPFLFTEHAQLVWTIIASLFVGNVILVVLNIPFIPLWVSVLRMPQSLLLSVILGFCVLGAYAISNSAFDIGVMLLFGLIGYTFNRIGIPLAPFTLTFVLGPMVEKTLRQSLDMSGGSFGIFVERPIALALLSLAAALVGASFAPWFRRKQAAAS